VPLAPIDFNIVLVIYEH